MSRKSRKEVEAIVSGMGVLMSFISSLVELVKKLGGTMEDIYRLATPEGRERLEAVARIIVGKTNKFLKLISKDEVITVDAVDGTEILAKAKDVFAYIDSDFKNWDANATGSATEETPVQVYETIKNATFSQMFGELNVDRRKLCLTQHQIKSFVKKHRKWLKTDGSGTFFLFESNSNFFVASTSVASDGELCVAVGQFEDSRVWRAGHRRRVVVPQLA